MFSFLAILCDCHSEGGYLAVYLGRNAKRQPRFRAFVARLMQSRCNVTQIAQPTIGGDLMRETGAIGERTIWGYAIFIAFVLFMPGI